MSTSNFMHARFPLTMAIMATSLAYGQPSKSTAAETRTYRVAQTFHVGGEGRWDYLTVDPEHKLLFVPRTTHTMVLDARTGKTVADIPGQKRNHGVAIVPSAGRGFITDGADASVTVFDLKTYAAARQGQGCRGRGRGDLRPRQREGFGRLRRCGGADSDFARLGCEDGQGRRGG